MMLVTIGMVAASVLTLSALQLNSLITALLDHTAERAQTTAQLVKNLVLERVANGAAARGGAPGRLADAKTLWTRIVEEDTELPEALAQILAQTKSVVEISVAGESGIILASSNRARIGTPMTPRLPLRALAELSLMNRLPAVMGGRIDYESLVPLGVAGQKRPVFTVQVLISSVLLRAAVEPEMARTALVSAAALVLAVVLAYWSSRLAMRPVARISEAIDRIAAGEAGGTEAGGTGGREYAVVQQKLTLLGQQYRGAQRDALELRSSVQQLMERLKQAESQMGLSARLAAINRLTSGVAHEIKNPLNSIALRLELLRTRVLEEVPEAAPELEVIAQEVTRLDRVVRTFLDFTRPVEPVYQALDMGAMLEEIADLIRPEAGRAGVAVDLRMPEGAVTLRGDADLLKQALLNMVHNALEVMPGGGRLGMAVLPRGSQCHIEISDTGPGIPPEQREKIFQLYYTTKKGGTGIGLAMAFRAAQLHGGTIEVSGGKGRGSTFTMRLPLAGGNE